MPLSANLQAAVKAFRHGSLANASGVLMRSLIVGRQRESIRKQPTALYSAVAKSNILSPPSPHGRLEWIFQRREGVAAMFQRGGGHS